MYKRSALHCSHRSTEGIQRSIENPLAAEMLGGRFHPSDIVRIDVAGDAFKFDRVVVN